MATPVESADKVRQKRFARRSRKGCITCRQRRKRCDEGKPTCENCVRVNVACEYAVPTQVPCKKRRVKDKHTTPEVLSPMCDAWDGLDFLHMQGPSMEMQPLFQSSTPAFALSNPVTSEQRFLLSYYIHTFVPTFSVVASSTAYHLSLYVPMALQSIGVLNGVLACAASHLAKSSDNEHRAAQYHSTASMHQMLAQDYLKDCVNSGLSEARQSDETIAVLMLLVALETQNGSIGSKWQKQLLCAGRIIAARGGPKHFINAGWESKAVFGHFLYHDCCSMIMNGILNSTDEPITTHLSTRTPDWTSLCEPDSLEVDLVSDADPLMGLASSLFTRIRRISRLRELAPNSPERLSLFATLNQEISNWCVQRDHAAGTPVNGLDLAAQLDLISLAETYRLGALILLYRTSASHRPSLPKIAKQIMGFVARIPDGNQVESGLPFPLFMAGGELVDWEDMQACARKLAGIKQRTKILNIQGVEEVLESVWRCRLNGEIKDWTDVLKEEQRVICVA